MDNIPKNSIPASHLTIKRLLGKGGFAAVYEGSYERPGAPRELVAIKVLQPAQSGSSISEEEYAQMFLREAACTKQQEHPHIIRCYGVCLIPANHPGITGLCKPALAMVLELAEPYTIKKLILQNMTENRRTYTNLQAYDWLIQIASALAHLHSNRPAIIHRDLKLDNVLLKRSTVPRVGGGRPAKVLEARLADLGLHVVAESDRSVLLRRKAPTDSANQSAHNRSVRSTTLSGSGSVTPGAGGGGGDLDKGRETPFLAITNVMRDDLATAVTAAATKNNQQATGSRVATGAVGTVTAMDGGGDVATGTVVVRALRAGGPMGRHGCGGVAPSDDGGSDISEPVLYDIEAMCTAHDSAAVGTPVGGASPPALTSAAAGFSRLSKKSGGGGGGGGRPLSSSSLVTEKRPHPRATASNKVMPLRDAMGAWQPSCSGDVQTSRRGTGDGGSPPPDSAPLPPPSSSPPSTSSPTSPGRDVTLLLHSQPLPSPSPPQQQPFPLKPPSVSSLPPLQRMPQAQAASPGALTVQATPQASAVSPLASSCISAAAAAAASGGDCNMPVIGGGGAVSTALTAGQSATVAFSLSSSSSFLPPSITNTACTSRVSSVAGARTASVAAPATATSIALLTPTTSEAVSCNPITHCNTAAAPATATAIATAAVAMGAAVPLPFSPFARPSSRSIGADSPHQQPKPAAQQFPRSPHPLSSQASPHSDAAGAQASQSPQQQRPYLRATSPPQLQQPQPQCQEEQQQSSEQKQQQQPEAASQPLPARCLASSTRRSPFQPQPATGTGAAGAGGLAGGATVVTGSAAGAGLASPSASAVLEGAVSIGTLISRQPQLVQPVSLGGSSFTTGLRSVRSLLTQFQQSELPPPRRASLEWVFDFTGRAGSCMYMAPEVFSNLPYNEKADTYSFAVLMYELLVREILIVSYFNTGKGEKMGLTNAEDYARKVCEGFRPPRPTCLADAAWALIADCWHDDPVQRPSMGSVLARLRALREAEAVQPTDPRVMGGCVPGCVLM